MKRSTFPTYLLRNVIYILVYKFFSLHYNIHLIIYITLFAPMVRLHPLPSKPHWVRILPRNGP